MKKFLPLIFCLIPLLFTSCLIEIGHDGSHEVNKTGKIQIKNRDPNREAYISQVFCRSSSNGEWVEYWNIQDYKSDTDCSFKIKHGYYDVSIRVIYPKYKNGVDYYEDFYTEDVYVYVAGLTDLTFDGRYLFETE